MQSSRATGRLCGSAVLVEDAQVSRKLYRMGFFGKFVKKDKVRIDEVDQVDSPLILSLYEALYLLEKEVLSVVDGDGKTVTYEELLRYGNEKFAYFGDIYRIYKHFRDNGYVVRSGLKFGALFSVYERGPGIDHAPLIVVFLEPDRGISAIDITRGGRLSHSVRKMFTLATLLKPTDELVLIGFEWFKP